eukprot:7840261-Pyramimonas_sp.AAC.2
MGPPRIPQLEQKAFFPYHHFVLPQYHAVAESAARWTSRASRRATRIHANTPGHQYTDGTEQRDLTLSPTLPKCESPQF